MTTFVLIVIMVLLLAAAFYLPRLMMRRAARRVVALFRERGATSPRKAVSLEELGIVQRGLMDNMFRMRDYRPRALRLLVQANIIRATESGRYYLSEEELERTQHRTGVKM